MEIKVGDVYKRRSDGKSYIVKKIDHKMVVLESVDGFGLSLTDVFALEQAYRKMEAKQTPESP